MGAKHPKTCSHNYPCGHTTKATAWDRSSETRKPLESSGIYGNDEAAPIITQAGFLKQIKIKDGSIGHGYQSLFGKYLDHRVTSVRIEDPYIRKHHQVQLMVRFCELLIKSCPKIETIHLQTGPAESDSDQELSLAQLKDNLRKRGISLNVTYSTTLHDRQIRLSYGLIIKIGRGLDYFKPVGRYTPGHFDLDLRPCNETTVDFLHI